MFLEEHVQKRRIFRNLRTPEKDHAPRVRLLDPSGQFEIETVVPDIRAEHQEIGFRQTSGEVPQRLAFVDRREETEAIISGEVNLGVGLEQSRGVREVVLPPEILPDLDQPDDRHVRLRPAFRHRSRRRFFGEYRGISSLSFSRM